MIKHTLIRAAATGFVTASLLAFPAFAKDDLKTEVRDVKPFTKIVLKGSADIILEAGTSQKVEVSGSEKKLGRLTTEVEDGKLVIIQKGRVWSSESVSITIGVQSLDSFVVEGAADATLNNIKSDDFELMIAGAGDVDINGTCVAAHVDIAGAGDINARKFKCETVDVSINGAGDAEIFASESVRAVINGVGDVSVYGNPKQVRPRVNGFGSIDVIEK